nr:hypothetical protein GCM10017611_03210 [Rhodococcus wratislaviensis]
MRNTAAIFARTTNGTIPAAICRVMPGARAGFQGLSAACGDDLPPIDHRATIGGSGECGGELTVPDPRAPTEPARPGELGQHVGGEGVIEVGPRFSCTHDSNRVPGARVSMSYRITDDPDPPDPALRSTVVPAWPAVTPSRCE